MTKTTQTVAAILEHEIIPTIERWMVLVDNVSELTSIPLSYDDRSGHLPLLLQDLITRLRLPHGAARPVTSSACDHGKVRFEQGYSVPLLVDESRLLQVSIFDTLDRNQTSLSPGRLMRDVITIADECDAQLKDSVETFVELEKHGRRAVA
jgi:hypothetical protein